jgi:uncharacterized membrane protein
MTPQDKPSKLVFFALVCDLLALAMWVGGLIVVVGAVIPAVFNSFGMEPGGRFLTRVFTGYNRVVAVAAAILITSTVWRRWQQQDLGSTRVQHLGLGVLVAMVVIAATISLGLGPWSVELQEAAFTEKDFEAKKVAYAAFFTIHMVVRALYLVNLGLGIALMAIKTKQMIARTST